MNTLGFPTPLFLPFIHLLVFLMCLFSAKAKNPYDLKPEEGVSVTYSVELLKSEAGAYHIKQNSKGVTLLPKINLSLRIKGEQGFFSMDEDPAITPDDMKALGYIVGVSTPSGQHCYWQDKFAAYQPKEFKMLLGKNYIATYPFENDNDGWNITGQTRKIDSYQCIKATMLDIQLTPNGEQVSTEIVAWFCPDLPYPFGPKRFGGLPGLIVELQGGSTIFKLNKIDVGQPVIIPDMPNDDKIPYNTLQAIIADKFKEIRGKADL